MTAINPVEVELKVLPTAVAQPLYGKSAPKVEVQKEEPWHRQAAYLFATGSYSATEVAGILDKTPATLQNLLRVEWFQNRVTALMHENGGKDIMALFKAEAFNSLTTLIEVRDDKLKPAAVRVQSARDILDRALGKPLQRNENTNVPVSEDPVAEVRQLTSELNRLNP